MRRKHPARQLLDLLAQFGLEGQILFLFLLDAFEIVLVPFIDLPAGLFETFPQRLLKLRSHRPDLAPLVVQFLQLVERFGHARFEHQLFGLFRQLRLRLVVLFEV